MQQGSTTRRAKVSDLLQNFLHDTKDTVHIQTKTYANSLTHQSQTIKKGHISDRYTNDTSDSLYHIPSFPAPMEIKDPTNVVMGYRFRLPIHLIQALEAATQHLPVLTEQKHKRGSYVVRHYAQWADFQRYVYHSSEYIKEKPAADAWLMANAALFEYLSNYLRIYQPESWLSMRNSIRKATDGELTGLATPWHGVAIGQGMGSEGGEDHQDWNDEPSVFNAVVPFGSQGWTGGEVVLWQLNMRVAVERGDCFLFKGAITAHRAEAVTSGQRNFIDLFCHKSVYDVARHSVENAGGSKHEDTRKVYPISCTIN